VWCDEQGPREAFLGSSNYTQLGFGISDSAVNHKEICVPIDPFRAFDYVLESSRGGISYKSVDIGSYVDLIEENHPQHQGIDDTNFGHANFPFVDLPLVMTRTQEKGMVHVKSGLNWGQREGRNKDQAYIPIPSEVSQSGFFPPRGVHFQVVTDDGEAFICSVAQAGGKALETPSDNAIIGRYFRKKLGLQPGIFITTAHLELFGSNQVRIYKDSDEFYRLSFQPGSFRTFN
jgi:hypothetical protein